MAVVLMSWTQGGSLDGYGATGVGRVDEATGGSAPTAHVELNIADGATREEVLKALKVLEQKVRQSVNLL